MTVQQAQQQQTQTGQSSDAARLLIVEKDVSGLKESMSSLATTVDKGFSAIAAEMKAGKTTNWQPVGICLGALLTVSGWGFGLFGSYQARTDAAIAEQKLVSAAFMSRADIGDRFGAAKEKNDLRQSMTDARLERIERDVERLGSNIVPRGEHVEQWAHQRTQDANTQRQVDQLRAEVSGLNSPRDTVQNILKRLEDIERARFGRSQ